MDTEHIKGAWQASADLGGIPRLCLGPLSAIYGGSL